jgi:hypothetical protein
MRLTVGKPQHQALLLQLATQLGSDRPIDALEHILNCWVVGNVPPPSAPVIHRQPTAGDDVEFDSLLDCS